MEQTCTQLAIEINVLRDKAQKVSEKTMTFEEFNQENSVYGKYQKFMQFYLLKVYQKTHELKNDLFLFKEKQIEISFIRTIILIVIGTIALFGFILHILYSSKFRFEVHNQNLYAL